METTVNGHIYSTPDVVKQRVTKRIPSKPVTQIVCIVENVLFPNAKLFGKLRHFTTRKS